MYDLLMVILVISPISLLLHEAGHTVAANVFTKAGVKLHLGIGPRIFTWRHPRGEVAVNAIYFAGGMTISSQPDKAYGKLAIAIAGPLMNLFVAALALILPFHPSIIAWVLFFNLWLGITNLIPFRILGKESDGWTILKVLLKKT
ncbi:site-2 protease family protein [Guptibacillus hwajinpoensis]|uniref:site-2 protease family protein n=1 Tax=Guptibacillus hwajinpoensis TaxID=208199 RepID=UPI001CFD0618|nr:site-2 protease family protein [Pseudalkalibacillus hwajinpoensis]WLR59623.1 site-2 protease family protein [Pseudalkalibacillus hwajinpoensis]